MMNVESFSAYDAKALKLLSGVLFDVKRTLQDTSPTPFGDNEHARVTRTAADRLMRDFDAGERNPDALRRAALNALAKSPEGALPFSAGRADRRQESRHERI